MKKNASRLLYYVEFNILQADITSEGLLAVLYK